MFYGVWTMSIRAEIIGHLFVAISVLINAVAVTVIRGITPPTLILYGVAFASVSRIWFLVATAEKRRIVGDST